MLQTAVLTPSQTRRIQLYAGLHYHEAPHLAASVEESGEILLWLVTTGQENGVLVKRQMYSINHLLVVGIEADKVLAAAEKAIRRRKRVKMSEEVYASKRARVR